MTKTLHELVLQRLQCQFDQRVMQNNLRGLYVEAMVAELLGTDWKQTADWAAWDMEHRSGIRLEVKQSAALQSWDMQETERRPARRFGIKKPKSGYWQGSDWVTTQERPAQMYVFAWHGNSGATADQRDHRQWEFYVASAMDLPDQDSIAVGKVRNRFALVFSESLRSTLEEARNWSSEA